MSAPVVVQAPRPEDVLVLRALGLGDALTGVAALRGVRRAWPGRRLVLAAPRPLGLFLQRRGVVDAVLPTDGLDPARADEARSWPGGHVAVDLHGRGPQSHRLLQAGRPCRLVAFASDEAAHDGPAWDPEEHEVARWCRLLGGEGGPCGPEDLRLPAPGGTLPRRGRLVLLHPGAAAAARRWPVPRWRELAGRLVRAGCDVVLTGGAAERDLVGSVRGAHPAVRSTAGRLDLDALARLVARAGLLVCGDTGVAHLATALGTPSVLLFGPTPPGRWGPVLDRGRHTVLWCGDAPGDPHAERVDPALEAIGVDDVWGAVSARLERVRPAVRRCG